MKQLLVDGDILCYRIAISFEEEFIFADGLAVSTADTGKMKVHADHSLKRLEAKTNGQLWSVCFSDAANFRKMVLTSYKAGRKSKRKPLGYRVLVEYIREHYPTHTFPACEADDTMGILATADLLTEPMIVSVDKDMLTIPCYLYNDKTEITTLTTVPWADKQFMLQTLSGDAVDEYSGCPGIGSVKAARLLDGLQESPAAMWEVVVKAYEDAGKDEAFALQMARCARILRAEDYNFETKEITLWQPATEKAIIKKISSGIKEMSTEKEKQS